MITDNLEDETENNDKQYVEIEENQKHYNATFQQKELLCEIEENLAKATEKMYRQYSDLFIASMKEMQVKPTSNNGTDLENKILPILNQIQ